MQLEGDDNGSTAIFSAAVVTYRNHLLTDCPCTGLGWRRSSPTILGPYTISKRYTMNLGVSNYIRKRREDEDDDMFLFIFPVLHLLGMCSSGGRQKKRRERLVRDTRIKQVIFDAFLPNQVHLKIERDVKFYSYFPNCIRAINGTHIPIPISSDKSAPLRNRNGTQPECNDSIWEISATDVGVLRSTMNSGFQWKFYLVDGGYANAPSFLAPYRGVQYHLKEYGAGHWRPQNYKEIFNHRHAVLRNHIERALGVLKKCFPILKVATFHKIENQVKIHVAATVLHNITRSLKGDEQWLDDLPDNIHGNVVDLPDVNMIGRGSPRSTMLFSKGAQKRNSPKGGPPKKHGGSPREKSRAAWNTILEKTLVDLLHEHNTPETPEAWNKIAKEFQERESNVGFTKVQIQDMEKELKRDYRALKEATNQSGASWDEKSHTAEGTCNFTSAQQHGPDITQFGTVEEVGDTEVRDQDLGDPFIDLEQADGNGRVDGNEEKTMQVLKGWIKGYKGGLLMFQ
ncbi:LOW QUALITY PROTEIN: hypothetical protein U9M48_030702 [Paspalum notatum var. saurae]|uniref:Myb/SANT-like domain-containing protein n=1 Tax=Paspalum notatum var. saurae TaxID=547442 RepID=A0AAQ3U5C4_PASNO